jgi:hypothetical protein
MKKKVSQNDARNRVTEKREDTHENEEVRVKELMACCLQTFDTVS